MVSLVDRALAAVLYEVEPIGAEVELVVQSELVANEPLDVKQGTDPRAADVTENPLAAELSAATERGAVLIHSTKGSHLRVAAAMEHVVRAPQGSETKCESDADWARFTVASRVKPGQRLTLVKFVAYGWSSLRSVPAMRSQVEGALAAAVEHGWKGLAAAQRRYLDSFLVAL